jgi:FkbH-like protein
VPPLSVVISSFFTAEPLSEPLDLLFRLLAWPVTLEFAPFAQVFQTLLGSSADTVHLVLARAEDIHVANFADALLNATGTALVQICAPHATELENELRARVAAEARISILSGADLGRLYPVPHPFDPRAHELGAIPYTAEYFTALAAHMVRAIHRIYAPPCKVIALDCDDTLWSGVCGEDGPEGVFLDESRRALQEFMKVQRASGRLLAIASKNNEFDVAETFRLHPEFPLRFDDFASRQIHWESKSKSLEAIASELNLGLNSLAFLDNDAKEVGEVAAELPGVPAAMLPKDTAHIAAFLDHVWIFDAPRTVTAEDLARADSYTAEARRRGEARQARSLAEFIAGLDLQVSIGAIEESQIARVAQLTQRTNQMNTTTRRLSESEVREFLKTGTGLAVRVRDRLGDYGLVGVMLLTERAPNLVVDSMILSCRALGRGVEHRMLKRAGEIAMERGLVSVEVEFESTAKNVPAHDFLSSLTYSDAPFVIRSEELARLEFRPTPTRKKAPASTNGGTYNVPDYQRIAELRRPADLLSAVKAERGRQYLKRASYETPRTDMERRLSLLWTDLLGVGNIGANDNFFDLGGHSLLAVQLVSRLHAELGIDLPLEAVYTGGLTIAELARSIELFELSQGNDAEYAAMLAEVENLSEEEVEALLASESSDANSANAAK